jgi:ABC-type nickel/cobalt efflux system permease component RcnA
MPSEQLFFIVAIVIVLGFAAWMVWIKYQDKWRTEEMEARRQERLAASPPNKHDGYRGSVTTCGNCGKQYPTGLKHCPECGKLNLVGP